MTAPLFPFTVAFCAGIALSGWIATSAGFLLLACSFLVLCCWIAHLEKTPVIFRCAALAGFAMLGVTWAVLYDASFSPLHLRSLVRNNKLDLSQPCRIVGISTKSVVLDEVGEQIEFDVFKLENQHTTYSTRGKVRLALYYGSQKAGARGPGESTLPTLSDNHVSSASSTNRLSRPFAHPGDLLEVLVNLKRSNNFNDPGQFDYVSYLERQGIYLVGTIKSELLITRIASNQGSWLQSTVQRVRGRLLAELDRWQQFSGEGTAALKALLLGTKQELSPQVQEEFQASGIYHVLVVSGQHVAILAAVLLVLMRLLRIPILLRLILAAIGLVFYCLLTENQPSIVRATQMTLFFLLTLHFDRDRDLLNSLSLSALILLVVDPFWLMDPGFQLSYLSVLAIAVIGIPLVRWTTEPYRNALRNLDQTSLDPHFSPHLADLRVALRLKLDSWNQTRIGRFLKPGKLLVLWPLYLAIYLADIFLISLGVQLLFVVLMVLYFHRVSIISVVVNILVIPLVGLIVPLGFLFLLCVSWIPAASHPIMLFCQFLTRLLLQLAHHFADPAWGNYRIPTPPIWVPLLYLIGLAWFVLWLLRHEKKKHERQFQKDVSMTQMVLKPGSLSSVPPHPKGWWCCPFPVMNLLNYVVGFLAVAAFLLLIIQPFPPRGSPGCLELTVLDVRQGDSQLLLFPDTTSMLVDGGGLPAQGFGEDFSEERFDIGERVVSPFLWSKGIKEINVVVLTHAHHDHLSGLNAVIRNFKVGELWIGRNSPTPEYLSFLSKVVQRGIRIRGFTAGERTTFHGAELFFLNPTKDQSIGPIPSNNDSLAFRLSYSRRSFLLTGDLERRIESRMLRERLTLGSDVLKIAHQGSRSSTTPDFLARVNPAIAIISTAASSSFGHPHPDVLRRLNERKVQLYRTDQDGAVTVLTDGNSLEVGRFLDQAH
jgi:competence protein ComEC